MMLSCHQAGTTLEIAVQAPHFEAGAARQFEEELQQSPGLAEADILRIDLRRVESIDSLAVHSLVSLAETAPRAGRSGAISLLNAQPPVQRVLRMLRLERLFSIEDSVAAPAA